jgi:hypothetical protein
MKKNRIRLLVASVAVLVVTVGVSTAMSATGGSDLSQIAAGITAKSDFESSVAESLGKTTTQIEAAVAGAGEKRIDDALAAGQITAAEAETLRGTLGDGRLAMRIATAADVASELGVTEEQLDEAYSAAHKARAIARVDAAVAANQITDAYAAELKAQIEEADFPGFGAAGKSMGHHGGFGGPVAGFAGGFGIPAAPELAPAALA